MAVRISKFYYNILQQNDRLRLLLIDRIYLDRVEDCGSRDAGKKECIVMCPIFFLLLGLDIQSVSPKSGQI